jgi:hypothetical protein
MQVQYKNDTNQTTFIFYKSPAKAQLRPLETYRRANSSWKTSEAT